MSGLVGGEGDVRVRDVAEEWSAAVLRVPRNGQVRPGRPRDADLVRHHKTRHRKVAEPSLVRRVTTARVFHEPAEELLRFLGLTTTRLDGQSHEVIAHLLAWSVPSRVLRCGSACHSVTRRSSATGQPSGDLVIIIILEDCRNL